MQNVTHSDRTIREVLQESESVEEYCEELVCNVHNRSTVIQRHKSYKALKDDNEK